MIAAQAGRHLTSIKVRRPSARLNDKMVSPIATAPSSNTSNTSAKSVAAPSQTHAAEVPSTLLAATPLRRHRGAFVVLLLLMLLAWPAWRWWRGPELSTHAVVRRDFVQTVVASGHVEAPHRVELGAQFTGTARRVPIAEGQSVTAEALLVELEAGGTGKQRTSSRHPASTSGGATGASPAAPVACCASAGASTNPALGAKVWLKTPRAAPQRNT
jgi:hypothetical protein